MQMYFHVLYFHERVACQEKEAFQFNSKTDEIQLINREAKYNKPRKMNKIFCTKSFIGGAPSVGKLVSIGTLEA